VLKEKLYQFVEARMDHSKVRKFKLISSIWSKENFTPKHGRDYDRALK